MAAPTRGPLADGRDDLVDGCAVGIDPRLLLHAEDRLQVVGARAGVGADAAVVVDDDALAAIALALVRLAVADARAAEAVGGMRSVAERLVLRAAAAAQRHRAHVGAARRT